MNVAVRQSYDVFYCLSVNYSFLDMVMRHGDFYPGYNVFSRSQHFKKF